MSSTGASTSGPHEPATRADLVGSPATHLATELVRAGIERFYVVPGSPASAVIGELRRLGARVRDARDEKSAAELAFGAAVVGVGSAVLIKGNGTPLALEPFQNAAAHQVAAAILLVVGDDVRCASSTVPTDARPLADAVQLPVVELIGPSTTRATITAAERTSRDIAGPVLVRFTATYLEAAPGPAPAWLPGVGDGARRPVPVSDRSEHRLTKDSRWDDYELRRRAAAHQWADRSPRVRQSGAGPLGVLVAGSLWTSPTCDPIRDADLPALAVTMVAPLPPEVFELADGLDELLVLEEGTPFLERAVRSELALRGSAGVVLGQDTLHVRSRGVRTASDVVAALGGDLVTPEPSLVWKDARGRADHPYEVLFAALRDVRRRRQPLVASCVGSSIDGAAPPWGVVDHALNLGGSINTAAAAAEASGRKAIALIGDYGLFHSGLGGHDQVHQHQDEVLTVVIANGRSEKTGGQETPLSTELDPLQRRDLVRMLRASAGDDRVHRVRLEDVTADDLARVLEDLLDALPATLVIEHGDDVDTGTWD